MALGVIVDFNPQRGVGRLAHIMVIYSELDEIARLGCRIAPMPRAPDVFEIIYPSHMRFNMRDGFERPAPGRSVSRTRHWEDVPKLCELIRFDLGLGDDGVVEAHNWYTLADKPVREMA